MPDPDHDSETLRYILSMLSELLTRFPEMSLPETNDLYQRVCNQWCMVETVHRAQQAAGEWDEDSTDALMDAASHAFNEAVTVVPKTLSETRHFIAMLAASFITENPEAVEKAIETLGQAVDGLIAREQRATSALCGMVAAASVPMR
jgi:hypothetical protein